MNSGSAPLEMLDCEPPLVFEEPKLSNFPSDIDLLPDAFWSVVDGSFSLLMEVVAEGSVLLLDPNSCCVTSEVLYMIC